jgi:hypothetical protein
MIDRAIPGRHCRRHRRAGAVQLGQECGFRRDIRLAVGGWSSLRMVERYASVTAEHSRESMSRMP